MGKMREMRNHPDPEYRRFRKKYPRFPGVAECVSLIKNRKARGAWADFVFFELSENVPSCWPELIQAFRSEANGDVRLYIMMALEDAKIPETVTFLGEVLRDGDERLAPYAVRALRAIDTSDARKLLWDLTRERAR